ncbi:STAS domain-containing protein [Actinorugispora endophytica]|uniref:Stage II sporulation protein AA (Anti-sigma F factor antagonist) n=1 Tax=Actinorugispora endophytica TaxID=1605990 RepID=A0A4R6UUK6_9ACTN|nr:STAS domain-containing protein [Actinorugispora endophytica]TDQ49589.1 stage II sporulation protein AA (anti-sigma F factor antagonist) [Actinorugispora endophytica]
MISVSHPHPPLVIRLRGEIDLATGPTFGSLIREAARGSTPGRPVIVDLSQVTFLDSGGLRALRAAHGALASRGVHCVLAEPRGVTAKVLELHSAARGIDVYPIIEAAQTALAHQDEPTCH